jgi:colanic acid/amylovoran biosynthesis protein
LNIAKEICKKASLENSNIMNYEGNIEDYLTEISICSKFIASRFHAVIIGFKFKIPTIPISYNVKTENLLKDLSLSESVLLVKDINKIKNFNFINPDEKIVESVITASKEHLNIV